MESAAFPAGGKPRFSGIWQAGFIRRPPPMGFYLRIFIIISLTLVLLKIFVLSWLGYHILCIITTFHRRWKSRRFFGGNKKFLNADKYSPASSAQSTKRWVRGDASVSGS